MRLLTIALSYGVIGKPKILYNFETVKLSVSKLYNILYIMYYIILVKKSLLEILY